MTNTAMIATDLSTASRALVECGGSLKQLGVRKVILAQCLGALPAASMAYSYDTHRADELLEYERRQLSDAGLEVETIVITSTDAATVEHTADQHGVGMIIIGSHSQTLLHELIAGGMVRNLSLHSRLPLLVLPLTHTGSHDDEMCLRPGACEDFLRNVLFPTDFSENADHAFPVLEDLVRRGCKAVTLMHVQESSRLEPHLAHKLDEFDAIDGDRLRTLADRLQTKSSVTVDVELTRGEVPAEIFRVAEERNASLIVMGTHGRGFLAEVHLGSVSQAVLRRAAAPLLLVPSAELEHGVRTSR